MNKLKCTNIRSVSKYKSVPTRRDILFMRMSHAKFGLGGMSIVIYFKVSFQPKYFLSLVQLLNSKQFHIISCLS